jgi:hypothetical protein
VTDIRKSKEVQFYLDRTIDSAVMIMRSIVHNPRLSTEEQIAAIKCIADFHASIALDLEKSIFGQQVSLSLKDTSSEAARKR